MYLVSAAPGFRIGGETEEMNTIIIGILCAVVFVVFITVKFAWEIHANNKRAERGEPLKKYHDATDYEIVNVIDWSKH